MLLTIIYSLFTAFFWALFCSLVIYSFQASNIFDKVREWLFCKITGLHKMDLLEFLYGHKIDDFNEERLYYYDDSLEALAQQFKLVRLLSCKVCFTVFFGIPAHVLLYWVFFAKEGVSGVVFCTVGVLLSYLFSKFL